jgi:hypothetical protein
MSVEVGLKVGRPMHFLFHIPPRSHRIPIVFEFLVAITLQFSQHDFAPVWALVMEYQTIFYSRITE